MLEVRYDEAVPRLEGTSKRDKEQEMTKELIEEARQQAAYLSNGHSKLLRRLADALAARQPTEDGTGRVEAWHRIAAHPAFSGCIRGDMPLIDSMTERLDSLSRAAVPDAATERERAELWRSLDWMLWGVGMGDVFREPLADKMIAALSDAEFGQAQDLIRGWDERRGGPHERNLFVEIKAERDAALAAVERVRAEASGVIMAETDPPNDWNQALDYMAKQILAALDGAPEPEWEFCFAEIHDDGEIYANGSDEGFQFATAEAARAARIEDSDVVMKRVKGVPAGPWLPVEGESRGD